MAIRKISNYNIDQVSGGLNSAVVGIIPEGGPMSFVKKGAKLLDENRNNLKADSASTISFKDRQKALRGALEHKTDFQMKQDDLLNAMHVKHW